MFTRLKFIAILLAGATVLPAQAQEYRYQSVQPAPAQAAPAAPATQPAVPPTQTASQPAEPAAPVAAPCTNCGTIDSIRVVEQAGEGSGLGMIAGGVLGGLLGHQIGSGRGNTAATIVGAAGGAYAGNTVEKNVKKTSRYEVSVRMDDGTMRTVNYDVEPGFRSGDKVRLSDGKLTRN